MQELAEISVPFANLTICLNQSKEIIFPVAKPETSVLKESEDF